MTDIFLSSARADRERVKILVEALEREGWTVWWDRKILPGRRYERDIEAALDAARGGVVAWSKHSINSDRVADGAEEGARRQALVPVLLEDVRVPLAFRRTQAADLRDWHGSPDHPELQLLLQAVRAVLDTQTGPPHAPEARAAAPPPPPAPPRPTETVSRTFASRALSSRPLLHYISDPNPETWSHNAASGNRGCAKVVGYAAWQKSP